MALRAKVRGKWRNVSKAMARVLRAHGMAVIDTEVPAVPTPMPVIVLPDVVQAYAPPLQPLKIPDDLTDDELERLTAPGRE